MQPDLAGSLPFLGLILGTLLLTFLLVGLMLLVGAIVYVRTVLYKEREEESLKSRLLQILVPRDNDIKIDAAEQMFSAFSSIYKPSLIPFLKYQPNISFEIVAQPESLKFYINTPEKYQDLIEKQIHAAYPGAEIRIVDEYNIFTKEGKVAFGSLRLKGANYFPVKTYKELATDPLSAITSAMAKMREGEGAALQIMITPSGGDWSKKGYNFVKGARSQETNSEKPRPADAKQLEAV